jgi:DNA-binding IclR family transcriptional regulator
LEEVRRRGYAVEQDEYLLGVWGAAVALTPQGGLPAALYSIGFTSSLTPGRLEQVARALLRAKQRIDAKLAAGRG